MTRLPLLLAFLILTQTSLRAADKPVPPLRALLITGGCCHDYDAQKEIIAKGLQLRANIDVTVVRQGESSTTAKIPLYEAKEWSQGFDVVIHDECFADVKDQAWVDNILKPHRDGLPGVVIHCAMHCYRDGRDEWFKFCGVTSRMHGAAYPHEVLNRDAAHPIMSGWGAAWANPAGELYWIEKVWPTAHPLASAKNRERGTEEVCVWTNEYGEKKTRVFGTTLGHHNETVSDPKFLDLLTRGTLWACGKLDDPSFRSKLKNQELEIEYVPINLALNKPATASSEESSKSNFAKHAVDGKKATRWCANGAEPNEWLQVDLERPKKINGIGLQWESEGTIYRYRIEGSANGTDWKLLVDQSKNEGKQYDHEFVASNIRFVKVTYLGSNTGAWGSLWELSVFGDEKIKVDPVAAKAEAERSKIADLQIPDAFEATLFAAPPAVNYPTFVAAAPDGTVYVSVDKNGSLDRQPKRGSVVRLRDLDGDGRADESKLFVADVDSPRGLVWDHDRLYLMHPPHLSAFIDKDGDGHSDEQQILVKNIAFGFKDRPADHTSNGVTLGIDGWLYLAIGDFGFLEAEGTDGRKLQLRGGGVVRVRPDGTGLELYSRGTRNILEVAVDPLLNGFTRDNTNDGGGWDIRLHHFTGLEDHGYPRLYMNFNDEIIQPLADYGGGSGCGAMFLDEPGFPKSFSPALFTADWGRNIVFRHQLTPHGATFKADQSQFLGVTRVTDLDVDANSNIYVASWKGATFTYVGEEVGYLVRVRPKGFRAEPLPDFAKVTNADLVALLKSPSHRRRLEAQRTLLRRAVDDATVEQLKTVMFDKAVPLPSRVAALFTLKQANQRASAPGRVGDSESRPGANALRLTERSVVMLSEALADSALRPYAIRAVADRWDELDPKLLPIIQSSAVGSSDPRTRLELAVALARFGKSDQAQPLVKWLADEDPVVRHTAIQSLIHLQAAEPCFALLDQTDSDVARAGAIRALQSIHQSQVVEGLIARLGKEADTNKRRGLLVALCRLHFVEGTWKGNSWGTRPDTRGPYFQPEAWAESDKIAAVLQSELERSDAEAAMFLTTQLARHRVELKAGLTTLIARAKTDDKFIPAVLAQVYRSGQLPNEALALVTRIASASDSPSDLRTQAAVSLLKSGPTTEESWKTIVTALGHLRQRNADSEVTNAFKEPATLNRHAKSVLSLAKADDASLWTDGALLLLAEDRKKQRKTDIRDAAEETLDAVWSKPTRRVQLLEAALLFNARTQDDLVLRGLEDKDAAVVAIAKKLADAWKVTKLSGSTGPKIATMKPEEVIAAVQKLKGDAARGEGLFLKLNCNKCHTVKPDEPIRGPYLPNVAKTYKREQLTESIVLPSKTIAQGFVTNLFEMSDGKQIIGFVISEAADVVIIRNHEGNELKLRVADIEERAKQTLSIMPDGLAKDLTVEDLAALVTYLETLAARATK
ncbi:MAG: discoidin domain-containing protein [Planctomycetaceae bacterium]